MTKGSLPRLLQRDLKWVWYGQQKNMHSQKCSFASRGHKIKLCKTKPYNPPLANNQKLVRLQLKICLFVNKSWTVAAQCDTTSLIENLGQKSFFTCFELLFTCVLWTCSWAVYNKRPKTTLHYNTVNCSERGCLLSELNDLALCRLRHPIWLMNSQTSHHTPTHPPLHYEMSYSWK